MIHTQRKAFAMLMALAVIIIMAVISALVINITNKTVTETTMQYQREQAALLAKSYTEYAILAVTANDRNDPAANCLENINGGINTMAQARIGNGFRVNVNISYIGDSVANNAFASCAGTRVHFGDNVTDRFGGNPATLTPLNIIVDVYVRYKDLNHPTVGTSPWHTYHRRTLQQI